MLKLILYITLIFSLNSVFALTPYIRYSPDVNPQDLLKIEPRLMTVMATIAEFCKQNRITFVVTSIIRDEKRNRAVFSVSRTHIEGRAFDFSTKVKWGWNKNLLDKLVKLVENKHSEYGRYGNNKQQKVILIHRVKNGYTHGHIQVVSNYDYLYVLNNQMRSILYGI